MENRSGKSGSRDRFSLLQLQNHWMVMTIASWKKSYDKPRQCIKKQRRHFADKGLYSESYDFYSRRMYSCESWTIKKAEHGRIYSFELWCWRRLLRIPWTERRSSKSVLREISPEYSLGGLMLKMKQ